MFARFARFERFERHLVYRIARVGAYAMALLLGSSVARGETTSPVDKPNNRACLVAYENAQEHERAGHLVEASQSLEKCAHPTCGSSLRQECAVRNAKLTAYLPSVVPLVTDDAGEAHVDVQVSIDGKLLTSHLDGLGLLVDPGTHEFSFSTGSGVFATQKLTISKGERNRVISVSLPSGGDTKAPISVRAE